MVKSEWKEWMFICKDLHAAVVNFFAEDSGETIFGIIENVIVHDNVKLHEATAVGSRTNSFFKAPDGGDYHQILIDIDVPHVYVPSTTRGHGHLIFQKRVGFSDYIDLLERMANLGLVQKGFVEAAKRRGEAWLRTPWTQKIVD